MVNNRSPRRRRTTTTAATAAAANDNTMPSPRTVSRAQLGLRVIPPASTDPRSQSPARSTRRRKLLAEDEGEDTVHAAAHAHEDNHEDGKLEVQQDCKPSPSKDDMPTAAPTPSSSANDVIGTGSIQNVHCFSAFHSHPHQAHLGTLLGHRVAKEFFESDDEERKVGTGKLYLGTVAAYSLPRDTKAEDGEKGADGTVAKEDVRVWDGTYHPSISATYGSSTNSSHCTISGPNNSPSKKTKPRKKQTKAAAARIAHAAKGITGVGIYRVLFDDGETDDQDPTETYECALEYHWQRQHRLDGTTATNTKRQRPVLAQDHSPTKPGALKSKGQVVSTEAGERELRRNANPPLIAAASGSNVGGNNVCRVRILDMELLGFWLAHEEYHRGIGIARPSPLVGSKSFVGWSELDEEAAAAAAGNVEKDETTDDMMGSTCTIKKKKKKRGRSHKIERGRAPIAPTVWTEEEEGKTLPLPKKRRCSPQKKEQSTTEAAAPPAEGIEEEEEETMLPQSKKRRGRPPKKEQSNREESMDRDESESDASEHGECNVDDGRAIVERDDSHGGETARVAGRIVHSKKRPGDDVVQDDQSNYEVKEGERSLDEEEEEDVQPQIAEVVPRALDALANARPLPHVPNNENELSMHSSSELSLPLEDGEQNAGQPTIGEGSRPGSPTPRSPVARRTAIRPRGRPAASLVQAAPAPAAMPPPDRSPPSLIDASMSSAGGSRIVDQVPPMNEMLSHQGSVQLESVAHESPPSPRLAARSPPPKRLGITQSPTWQRKSPSLVPASGKLCKVEGCGKFKQSGKNDMCCSHFTESQRAHEQLQLHSVEDYGHKDGWAEDEDSLIRDAILKAPRVHGAISEAFLTLAEGPLSHRSQSAIESRWFCVLRRSHEKTLEARSEAEARKVRPSYFCIVDGCSKQRQSGKGGMCCSHFTESQEMAEETSESEDETQASIGVGRNNRWTEEEDEIIRDAIQTSSTAKEAFLALAAGPLSHRSWSAIQNHWYADVKPSVGEESSESEDEDEEKTPVSNGVGRSNRWTEEEDEIIRDAIQTSATAKEAFLALAAGPLSHRSWSAIQNHWYADVKPSVGEESSESEDEDEDEEKTPASNGVGRNNRWTEEEDEIIRDAVQTSSTAKEAILALAAGPLSHRSWSAIQNHWYADVKPSVGEESSESEDEDEDEEKTPASNGVGRYNRWTEEEDEIIRDAVQTSSTAKEAFLALAAGPLSHRSWSAIQNHWYADVKPSVGEESSESEDEDEEKTPVSNGVGRSNRWTEEEDEIIRDAIQTSATAKEAFLALAAGPLSHRSWSAIQNHWYADVKPSMGDTSHSGKPPRSSTSKSALDTLAKAAAAQPLGSRLPNLKWTDEEIESLISAVEEARRNGRSKEDAFNEVLRGALSHRSLNSIRARWYNTKQAPKKSASAASSSSGSPSEEIEDPNGDLTRGLPSSSDDWIYPETTNISLSHPDAVHHKETSKSLKIPSHQRLVAVPNRSESESLHTFILSVYVSTVPNAGRGLFLTYCGPDAYWTVPDYVDLGCYGPHTASDIKQDFLMEVKNFLYHDNPSEWSFDAPKPPSDEESSEAQGLTVHGKKIIKDMLFDITDDATGEVHAMAEQTLLPFVNEVTVQGKNASQKLKQVQNIDAVHHDDGTLHYLLRSGSRFKRGKTTELFVYYGAQYDGNRNRKHSAYSDRKECNHHSPVVMVKDRAGGDGDDMSGITDPPSNSGGIIIANDCGLLTASGHPIQRSVCPSCNEHSTKLCVKTTASLSQYTNMRKSIFTYTEKDIIAVLDLFISSPPIESVPRQRMWWIADQIRPYLSQILYRNGEQKIPPALQAKLDLVFDLFPRGRDTPYHDDDEDAKKKHKYMGVAIRKEVGTSGFKTGMVEHMVSSSSGSIDDVLGVEQRKYLVVYFSGEGEEIVTEQEIIDGLLPNSFGMLG